ncbi:MAG TPA: tryptophan synthase subunit alpha [Gaiellales bacterium]
MNVRTPALAIYLMAGEDLPDAAAAAVAAGATAIEVGIPFSDPLADGPVIQRAAQAALAAGMTPPRCLELLAATRARLGDGTPLIPMTYAAIVERYGPVRFCADAAAAGATGLIVADVPPDDGDELQAESARNGIDLVQLISLTSAAARLELACRTSRGFIYVVSAIGTTGARDELDVERLRGLLARVRAHAGELPLLCGFGVSRAAQVSALRAAGADGVIVGSAAIAALESGGVGALAELVGSLAGGL